MPVSTTTCVYNAGNAKPAEVESDFDRLFARFKVTCLVEVADRAKLLRGTGAQILQGSKSGQAHFAIMAAPDVVVVDHGYVYATPRTWVGAWGAGPATLATKWIQTAVVEVPDALDQLLNVWNVHLHPSVTRPAKGPVAKAGRARRRRLYAGYVAAIVAHAARTTGPIAIHGDWNAEPDFELLQPLRDAGFVPMAAPSFPSDKPAAKRHPIDVIWVRGATPESVRALEGFSSDHCPVAGTYSILEEPPVSYFPGADRKTQWFSDDWSSSPIKPNVLVLHDTETTDWPGYENGAKAPTYTAKPLIKAQKFAWRQHFEDTESARALRNEAGGVETNTLNCIQIELIGTTDPAHRKTWGSLVAGVDYIYWPEAPAWALQELADFVAYCHKTYGIRLEAPVFLPYPESAGQSKVRFTFTEWRNFYGVCAHMHVPENDHGDVYLDIQTVLRMAKGSQPKPPTRVEKARDLINEALVLLEATPDTRKRVHAAIPEIHDWLDTTLPRK